MPGALPAGPYQSALRLDPLTWAGAIGCAFDPSQKNACSVQVDALGKIVVAALKPFGHANDRDPVESWQILNAKYCPDTAAASEELVTFPVNVIVQELTVLLVTVKVGVAENVTEV